MLVGVLFAAYSLIQIIRTFEILPVHLSTFIVIGSLRALDRVQQFLLMLRRVGVVLVLVLLKAVLAVAEPFRRWVVRTWLLQRVELVGLEVEVGRLVLLGVVVVGRHVEQLALAVELRLVVRVVSHSSCIRRRFLRSWIRTWRLITGGACLVLGAALGAQQLRQVLPLHHLLSEIIPILHVRRASLLIGEAAADSVILHAFSVLLRPCGQIELF